jgi:Rieske [2Fe-2S] domain
MALNTFLSLSPQCHCHLPFKSSAHLPKTTFCSQKPHSKRNRRFSLRVATPSYPTSPISREQEEGQVEEPTTSNSLSDEKFSWRDNWYPISLVEDLDPRYPTPFQLLNRDLVIWKDPNSGEWVALDDKCPHRLAPLSVIFPLEDVPFFTLFCFVLGSMQNSVNLIQWKLVIGIHVEMVSVKSNLP